MYTIIGAIGGLVFIALFFRSSVQLHLLGPSASLFDCLTDSSGGLFACTDYGEFVLPLLFGATVGGVIGSVVNRAVARKHHTAKSVIPNVARTFTTAPVVTGFYPNNTLPELTKWMTFKTTGNPDQERLQRLAVDDSPDGLLEKGLSFLQIAEECSTDREYLQLMSRAYHEIRRAVDKGGSGWSERVYAERLLGQIRRVVNAAPVQ